MNKLLYNKIMRFDNRGNITLVIIALSIAFGFVMIGGFSTWDYTPDPNPTQTYEPVEEAPEGADQALQLRRLGYATIPPQPSPTTPPENTPIPTPTDRPTTGINPGDPGTPQDPPPPNGPVCQGHAPKPMDNSCTCPNGQWTVVFCQSDCGLKTNECPNPSNASVPSGYGCGFTVYDNKCLGNKARIGQPGCTVFCWAKPVIYLYPVIPTLVDVVLTIPGRVTISNPEYPTDTGWQNVLAYPNGTLFYKGLVYHDLFYETEVNKKSNPKTGLVIPVDELEPTLSGLATQFGLNDREKQEYMEYWLPELRKLEEPYIQISVLNFEEKQIVDKVDFNPYPDTFIHFLTYFKPLNELIDLPAMEIPQEIPQRKGFTAVEWGGSIDHQK